VCTRMGTLIECLLAMPTTRLVAKLGTANRPPHDVVCLLAMVTTSLIARLGTAADRLC
jgi:hypothetical protein